MDNLPTEHRAKPERHPIVKKLAKGTLVAILAAGTLPGCGSSDTDTGVPTRTSSGSNSFNPETSSPTTPTDTITTEPQDTTTENSTQPGKSPNAEKPYTVEGQTKLIESLRIPEDTLSLETLKSYVDQDALKTLVGVEGGIGLWPEVSDVLSGQERAARSMTLEDFVLTLDRVDELLSGTHLDVIDGKVTTVPNSSLIQDGGFEPINEEYIDVVAGSIKSDATKHAAIIADKSRGNDKVEIATKLLRAAKRVEEHYIAQPDEERQMSNTAVATVLESMFVGNPDPSAIEQLLGVTERLALGSRHLDSVNFSKTKISKVIPITLKSADGKTEVTIPVVQFVGEDQMSRKPFAATAVALPAKLGAVYDERSKGFVVGEAAESFNVYLVSTEQP